MSLTELGRSAVMPVTTLPSGAPGYFEQSRPETVVPMGPLAFLTLTSPPPLPGDTPYYGVELWVINGTTPALADSLVIPGTPVPTSTDTRSRVVAWASVDDDRALLFIQTKANPSAGNYMSQSAVVVKRTGNALSSGAVVDISTMSYGSDGTYTRTGIPEVPGSVTTPQVKDWFVNYFYGSADLVGPNRVLVTAMIGSNDYSGASTVGVDYLAARVLTVSGTTVSAPQPWALGLGVDYYGAGGNHAYKYHEASAALGGSKVAVLYRDDNYSTGPHWITTINATTDTPTFGSEYVLHSTRGWNDFKMVALPDGGAVVSMYEYLPSPQTGAAIDVWQLDASGTVVASGVHLDPDYSLGGGDGESWQDIGPSVGGGTVHWGNGSTPARVALGAVDDAALDFLDVVPDVSNTNWRDVIASLPGDKAVLFIRDNNGTSAIKGQQAILFSTGRQLNVRGGPSRYRVRWS